MVRDEQGFTLVELVTAMAILGGVMTAVMALYISGVRSTSKLTSTFQAQTSLHVGLTRLRTDVHVACSETAQSATSVTLSMPVASAGTCDGTSLVTWCTQGSGSVYGLYRISGSTCSGGVKYADYLTSGSIFTYTADNSPASSYALPRLHVDVTVNATPSVIATGYRVIDDIVFENGIRT